MPDPNQHIIDELNRFREAAETFYAIQIDAPWGSGKTHFVKNYIKNHCPQDTAESPKNLIISLFGVKSVQEIEQQIASQLFSGGERLAGFLFSTLATGVSGFFKVDKATSGALEESRARALSERLKEVRKGIVVFDDIERCSMKLVDALGYINKFVEREGFKVVLVSNELAFTRSGALKEEQENSVLFKGFKEKLVGRTLQLKADPENAFDAFASSLKCARAKEIALKEKTTALAVFRASKRENLRSLRIALEAFDRLVSGFDPDIPTTDEGLRDILAGCIYVAIEVGAAVKHVLVAYPTAGRMSRLMRGIGGSAASEPSEDELVLNDIVKRYSDVLNLQSPTVSFEFLLDFIASAVLKKQEIEHALRISPLMAGPSKSPLWRRLIEVWDFNTDRLKEDTKELINKFAQLDILDPGELIHLTGIILWRESQGDLLITGGIDPEKFMTRYLSDLKASGKHLDVKLDVFAMDRLSAYGYVVLGSEEFRDKLLRIHALIASAMNEAASQRFPEVYAAICGALASNTRDMNNLVDRELIPYLRMPIFKNADFRGFADLIMRHKEFDVKTVKWLSERYDNHVTASVKREEQAWLDALYNELCERISTLEPPLNMWWMRILVQNLQRFVTPSSPVASSEASESSSSPDDPATATETAADPATDHN